MANLLVAPARARYVDRAGQASLVRLPWPSERHSCAVAALSVSNRTPGWLLDTVAGLAGLFPPPLGAAMRVRWTVLTSGTDLLPRAYSVDAVAEELLFVTGPVLVAVVVRSPTQPSPLSAPPLSR